MIHQPPLTLGVEEEYLLVHLDSRDLVRDPDPALMQDLKKEFGKQVASEFLRSQVEIGTRVCRTAGEIHADLARLRRGVATTARRYGYAPIAASTHPFARWSDQTRSDKSRYRRLAHNLAGAVRRLLTCGMHVHVGIDDDDMRIDLMNQFAYFLPHLLTLSTSSPFWQGEDMGLDSYRITVFDALPRTGVPDEFESYAQYMRLVDRLTDAGVIDDASMIWWDVRPSAHYPTLESRITDVCTRLEDAVTLAALHQCILSALVRMRMQNRRWRIYPHTLVRENRWRAQRYGVTGELIDLGKGKLVPVSDLVGELCDIIRDDAEQLQCRDEVARAHDIVRRGTSAHHQRRVYKQALDDGADHDEALIRVVDHLIAATVEGLDENAPIE